MIPLLDLSPSTAFLFYLGTIMNPQASKGWIKSGIPSMNKVDCSAMRAALGTLVITVPLLLGRYVESRAAGQQNVPEGKKEISKTDLDPKDRQVDRKPDQNQIKKWMIGSLFSCTRTIRHSNRSTIASLWRSRWKIRKSSMRLCR